MAKLKQTLLETPAELVSPELVAAVADFCEPIDLVSGAYVGLLAIREDGGPPRRQLAVALVLARPPEQTVAAERELQRIVERFYDSMPEDVVGGGCNLLLPAALDAWGEKARRVFSR